MVFTKSCRRFGAPWEPDAIAFCSSVGVRGGPRVATRSPSDVPDKAGLRPTFRNVLGVAVKLEPRLVLVCLAALLAGCTNPAANWPTSSARPADLAAPLGAQEG